MFNLYSCIRRLVLVRVCLFFSSCACRFKHMHASRMPMHATSFLHMHVGWQKPLFGLWNSFFICSSSICNFNIIPQYFASNCISHVISHPIVNPISFSDYSFHLTMHLISFFSRFYLHTLAEGVSVGHWYGTVSLSRRLEDTYML